MTKLWTGHESVTNGQTDGRSLLLYPPFFFKKTGDNTVQITRNMQNPRRIEESTRNSARVFVHKNEWLRVRNVWWEWLQYENSSAWLLENYRVTPCRCLAGVSKCKCNLILYFILDYDYDSKIKMIFTVVVFNLLWNSWKVHLIRKNTTVSVIKFIFIPINSVSSNLKFYQKQKKI
jgi:hypothetical protein